MRSKLLLCVLLGSIPCCLPGQTPAPPAAPPAAAPIAPPVVRTASGLVAGKHLDGGIQEFKGIPFAAPPTGKLRWRPPQPVSPWKGVRPCREYGPSCIQTGRPLGGRLPGRQSEDCLYLNVWTPGGGKRPVMVWIHGGGNSFGSGAMPYYDGRRFAAQGVVLVTINYRLGPLGYLAHPGLSRESPQGISGNYGSMDQVAALRWVQANIAAFGGDPGRVTIFGESAGGLNSCVLLVTPAAAGLFHRAIAQSGTAQLIVQDLRRKVGRRESAESEGVALARRLGVDGDDAKALAALRSIPAARVLKEARPGAGLFAKGLKYGPIVDGCFLPDRPADLLAAGRFHRVPLMIGSNADEATLFLGRVPIKGPLAYRLLLRRLFPGSHRELASLFPAGTRKQTKASLNRLVTTMAFTEPARSTARAVAARGQSVWLYHFSRAPKLARGRFKGLGATHGLEIPYVFGLEKLLARLGPRDRELAGEMTACWTRFAATGDPNPPGNKTWPPYRAETDRHYEFGDRSGAGQGLRRRECDLLERIRIEATAGKRADRKP